MKKFIEQRHDSFPMPLIHPVLVEGVRSSVADFAKGDEVIERVVPQLSGKAHAPAVDMVDVQRVGGSAFAALAAVAFQRCRPVAAEMVVIDGSLAVAPFVRAPSVGLSDERKSAGLLAGRAPMLRAGAVWERLTAVGTGFLGTAWRGSFVASQLHLVRQVRARSVGRAASRADDLAGCSRFIRSMADAALAFVVAVASHADRLHRARLAPLHVGGKTLNKNATVGAGQNTVFAHGLTVSVGGIRG